MCPLISSFSLTIVLIFQEISQAQNFTIGVEVKDDGIIISSFSPMGYKYIKTAPLSAVLNCTIVISGMMQINYREWLSLSILSSFPDRACQPFAPKRFKTYSPHCSFYTFHGTDKENLFDNRKLLKLVFISFIPITFSFDTREEL